MITNTKILKQVLTLICIINFLYTGISHALTLQLNIRRGLIDIHAENTALIDILDAISRQTGMTIKTDQQLLEKVRCDFKGIEIESCISRLMTKYNYNHVIIYKKGGDNRFVMKELQISGDNPQKPMTMSMPEKSEIAADPPYNPIKPFEKSSYREKFKNRKELDAFISAMPVDNSTVGLKLNSVEGNSIFGSLGLSAGDVIKNINGSPIKTKKDLIDGLMPPLLPSLIRIEREDKNAQTVPIYIQLR